VPDASTGLGRGKLYVRQLRFHEAIWILVQSHQALKHWGWSRPEHFETIEWMSYAYSGMFRTDLAAVCYRWMKLWIEHAMCRKPLTDGALSWAGEGKHTVMQIGDHFKFVLASFDQDMRPELKMNLDGMNEVMRLIRRTRAALWDADGTHFALDRALKRRLLAVMARRRRWAIEHGDAQAQAQTAGDLYVSKDAYMTQRDYVMSEQEKVELVILDIFLAGQEDKIAKYHGTHGPWLNEELDAIEEKRRNLDVVGPWRLKWRRYPAAPPVVEEDSEE
jgi:hypothetical protein